MSSHGEKDRLQEPSFTGHGAQTMVAIARGKFLVLEGIDGSGTTTQLDRAVAYIGSFGHPAVATREPSTGPIGRLLREALLGQFGMPDGTRMAGRTMALLFAADRSDHLQREIEPHLASGTTVVSDRYLLSSLAYQAEEVERDWVLGLARGSLRPDLTLLLDLPIDVAAKRRRAAGRPVERYDADSYLAKVAANYRGLAKQDPSVVVLDGAAAKDEVTEAMCRAIAPLFAPTGGA
jgi:dTMP kinase